MPTSFIGEIRAFAGNFAPDGWAPCDGQWLPIQGNTALYAVIGTTYGGDSTRFALPDLQARVPLQAGQGAGLSLRKLGEQGGEDYVTLFENELAPHSHAMQAAAGFGSSNDPAGDLLAQPFGGGNLYGHVTDSPVVGNDLSIGYSGDGMPHENRMPTLGLMFCIALEGIFPPKPVAPAEELEPSMP